VAEGLAAGVLQVIPSIIVLRAFDEGERGKAMGIFGFGVVLAPAVGPSVGGVLVEHFGWRSIFFFVVPFALCALWLARRYLPVSAPGGGAPGGRSETLDAPGLALAAVVVVGLLNGLVQLQGPSLATALGLLSTAVLLLGVFVWLQRRTLRARQKHPTQGSDPLMNLSLFADRRFAMGSMVAFIYGIALFGSTYLLPVYMQMGLHLSASLVGSVLLPAGLVLAVTIALVGRLVDRQPAHRLVSIGLALLALSFALMLSIDPRRPAQLIPLLVSWAILGRIGLGFILPSLNLGALRGLERTHIPQGVSVINFLRMLGGAAGVSLCGIVLEWRMAAHGTGLAEGVGATSAQLAAFDETFLMLSGLCALALLASWNLREKAR